MFSTGVERLKLKVQVRVKKAVEVHIETKPWFALTIHEHLKAELGYFGALSRSWLLGQVQLPLGASVS